MPKYKKFKKNICTHLYCEIKIKFYKNYKFLSNGIFNARIKRSLN